MGIAAKDVQKLRERTGVGMMDCKKALVENDGDFDKAIAWLREKGLAVQTKKAGKVAAEGATYATVNDQGVGVIVEVNSQTDFVARNEVFLNFVKDVAQVIGKENPKDVETLRAMTYPGTDRTIADVTADKVLAIGENIQIRRFARYDQGVSVPYVHLGGKMGVLVNLEVDGIAPEKVTTMGKDVAMQIASMNPIFLDESQISPDVLYREREIFAVQTREDPKNQGKPDQVMEKIVAGKLKNYLADTCLLQQAFIRESGLSVQEYVTRTAKELGGSIQVKSFVRFLTGEGIEKEEDNFAAEVASMIH